MASSSLCSSPSTSSLNVTRRDPLGVTSALTCDVAVDVEGIVRLWSEFCRRCLVGELSWLSASDLTENIFWLKFLQNCNFKLKGLCVIKNNTPENGHYFQFYYCTESKNITCPLITLKTGADMHQWDRDINKVYFFGTQNEELCNWAAQSKFDFWRNIFDIVLHKQSEWAKQIKGSEGYKFQSWKNLAHANRVADVCMSDCKNGITFDTMHFVLTFLSVANGRRT